MKIRTKVILIILSVLLMLLVIIPNLQLSSKNGGIVCEYWETAETAFNKDAPGDAKVIDELAVIDLENDKGVIYVADTSKNYISVIHMATSGGKYSIDASPQYMFPRTTQCTYNYMANDEYNNLNRVEEESISFSNGIIYFYFIYSDLYNSSESINKDLYKEVTFMSAEKDINRREVTFAWRLEEYLEE